MSKRWTDEQTKLAREMLSLDEPDAVFRERLGRSRHSAVNRLDRIKYGYNTGPRVVAPSVARIDVPAEMFEEAVKRANAPRSLTALLMGDPAPGFSAWGRKQSGASA